MIEIWHIVFAGTLVLGGAALAFARTALRAPSETQRYLFATAVAAGGMAIAYAVMTWLALTGRGGADTARFLGYTIMWAPIVYVTSAVAGVRRGLAALLYGIIMARVWVTFVSWYLEGTLALVTGLFPSLMLVVGTYVLYVPFSRVAETRVGERTLLFNKLKHLIVLAWFGLVAGAFASGRGLIDAFVLDASWFYVEAILILGFGAIVRRNADALEATADAGGAFSAATATTERREEADGANAAD